MNFNINPYFDALLVLLWVLVSLDGFGIMWEAVNPQIPLSKGLWHRVVQICVIVCVAYVAFFTPAGAVIALSYWVLHGKPRNIAVCSIRAVWNRLRRSSIESDRPNSKT